MSATLFSLRLSKPFLQIIASVVDSIEGKATVPGITRGSTAVDESRNKKVASNIKDEKKDTVVNSIIKEAEEKEHNRVDRGEDNIFIQCSLAETIDKQS